MDYYRKFKSGKPIKPANHDSATDTLDEVESKWADMQPRIQECVSDKSKVQKQMSEIRTFIEHAERVGEKVSEDQQEKIKDITKKCKEVLVKFRNVSDINTYGVKSPRPFPKMMSSETNSDQAVPQNKVALVEVEEKLKSMRQRRLDRLSVFVAEQSKLSEERSNKSSGSNEIENAIKSIQQSTPEKKHIFKPILEDNSNENEVPDDTDLKRHSSESTDKSKPSSAKKFINKFNCTTAIGSSNEDLTRELDVRERSHVIYKLPEDVKSTVSQNVNEKHDFNRTRSSWQKDKDAEDKNNAIENDNRQTNTLKRSSLQNSLKENKTSHRDPETDNYNPLLSPIGKQRRAVYLYDNECKFLENEKQSPIFATSALGTSNNQEQSLRNLHLKPKVKIGFYENREIIAKNDAENTRIMLTTFGKTNQENLSKKPDAKEKSTENVLVIDKNENETPRVSLTTFGKNNNEDETGKTFVTDKSQSIPVPDKGKDEKKEAPVVRHTYENINITTKSQSSSSIQVSEANKRTEKVAGASLAGTFKPHKSNSLTRLVKRTDETVHRKSCDNVYLPRSPVPSKRNHSERVLKKLQRNWDSLNEIMENDSDVDCEEIEDLKKTWEEANRLLVQYKARIDKLERKQNDAEKKVKLSDIKVQLDLMGDSLTNFRGLKRDSSYKQLSSRLSNYFLVVNTMNCSRNEVLNEKRALLGEIERHIKTLESKVNRNETILLEILEAQVKTIGTKYLNITQV